MTTTITPQEKQFFETVQIKLHNRLKEIEGEIYSVSRNLQDNKRYLWDNIREIDGSEKATIRQSITMSGLTGESIVSKRERIQRLIDSPYFGRIDFTESDCNELLRVYVGIHPFYDNVSESNLIFDWRAPISSMFYDFELGDASYVAPSCTITGTISLKRQYRIRRSVMEFMLESSLNIHDDILQKELSSTSDEKMKTIVATIQKDQNRIIRNSSSPVLIIQGAAGSGKTSIALHRIAFLLYSNRDTITSENIMIISPNRVFADYISNVLPELGEGTIPEINFDTIALNELEKRINFQTFFEQVSELLETPDDQYIERIKFKASYLFVTKLQEFILYIENNFFTPQSISIGEVTISDEFILQRFKAYEGTPIKQRLNKVSKDVVLKIEMSTALNSGMKSISGVHSKVKNMFKTHDLLTLYKEFYSWLGQSAMFNHRKGRTVEFSDVFPLVYLKMKIEGSGNFDHVKHLVIDEMQDYTQLQYTVISDLFKCNKTILGDSNQSVNPYSSTSYREIQKVFTSSDCFQLNKSYRSSYEIANFAQGISYNPDLIPIERHGDEPIITIVKDETEQLLEIKKTLTHFAQSSNTTVGIICKKQEQAAILYDQLHGWAPDVFLLNPESTSFQNGVVITTAHMAKGLEFDQVIIPFANSQNYKTDIDKCMLYIASTRALHTLHVIAANDLTHFIPQPELNISTTDLKTNK